ncbi:MAG: GH25 family lysozyme [Dehalococcoidia bacterium]|jgi:GH25 family lysozyme M1 (1,4-beta-N-acetylmuramidase)
MGIKFSDFPINGIDVSEYNGVIDWNKVKCNFASVRVGYGKTIDYKFKVNWAASKGKVKRYPYWYMDYYSNHIAGNAVNGVSDSEWGKRQAQTCWNAIKSDPEGIVFLDIESTNGSYAPKIQEVQSRVHRIARAFLEEIDRLSGKKNGMYLPVGWLSWYTDWFRDRPLWVAWYPYRTANISTMSIVQMVIDKGWKTKPLFWQYASDGDLDDNGTSDGRSMGMKSTTLDLNGWVATQADYLALFGTQNPPDDEVIVIPPVTNTRVIQIKESIRTLTLRKKPEVSWLTKINIYPAGVKFDCLEEKIVDGNIWQRVGINQYVADVYDGEKYLK